MKTTSRSEYIIDHGVEVAPIKRGAISLYPFRKLTEVGDAFFVPLDEVTPGMKDHTKEASLRSLCSYWRKAERWPDGKARGLSVRYIKHKSGRYGYQVTRTA